ncbi:MAG: glutamine synthetase [Candidatus Sericytochromatia bacterium]|nr:glutamine synthetase [Candidatus Tanganyikabacteria bacterium]
MTSHTLSAPRHELVETFRNDGLDKVKVGGFDIDGVFRGKYISIDKLGSAMDDGFGFCDVIFGWDSGDQLYDNVQVTGWHSGYPDLIAQIDASTFRKVPWEDDCPLFIVDFHKPGGEPFEVAPRNVLKRTVARAHQLGYEPLMSAEFEFWFFREDPESVRRKRYRDLQNLSPGMFGYSVLRASAQSQLVADIMRQMKAYDVELEGFHTETGPGVFEAAIKYDTAVRAADKAALFKTGLKEIACRHGLMVTFMAKWSESLPGSSGHIHQSLVDLKTESNAFHDASHPLRMSELFQHYTAGQLAAIGDLMPLVAPTINSYKRTVPGTWAPTTATWSVDNRTAALRAIPGSPKSTRLEFRLAGADINPYLAFAACLAGGLYGIEQELALGPPLTGNAYENTDHPLPRTLEEATDRFRRSDVARAAFGDVFVDHFAATRDWEVRAYQKAVTDFELARYFEII